MWLLSLYKGTRKDVCKSCGLGFNLPPSSMYSASALYICLAGVCMKKKCLTAWTFRVLPFTRRTQTSLTLLMLIIFTKHFVISKSPIFISRFTFYCIIGIDGVHLNVLNTFVTQTFLIAYSIGSSIIDPRWCYAWQITSDFTYPRWVESPGYWWGNVISTWLFWVAAGYFVGIY